MYYLKLKHDATREFLPTPPAKRRIINVSPGEFEGEQDAATKPAHCEDYDVTPAESSTSTFTTLARGQFCYNQDNSSTASSEVLSRCKKCELHIKEKKNLRRKLKRMQERLEYLKKQNNEAPVSATRFPFYST